MEDTVTKTDRGFDRIVFFSDAVVAIAITLLILPLVDKASDAHSGADLFRENGSEVLAFVISFVVIARYWVSHHRVFEQIGSYDARLMWTNFGWLASIVFFPFPSEVLGSQDVDDAVVRFAYIGAILMISLWLLAIEVVVVRTPSLWADPDGPGISITPAVTSTAAVVVALVVGTAVPAIGLWSLLLIWPAVEIGERVDRRRVAAPSGGSTAD